MPSKLGNLVILKFGKNSEARDRRIKPVMKSECSKECNTSLLLKYFSLPILRVNDFNMYQ